MIANIGQKVKVKIFLLFFLKIFYNLSNSVFISPTLLFCLLFIQKLNAVKNTTVDLKSIVFCENYQDLFVEQPLQKNHHLGK